MEMANITGRQFEFERKTLVIWKTQNADKSRFNMTYTILQHTCATTAGDSIILQTIFRVMGSAFETGIKDIISIPTCFFHWNNVCLGNCPRPTHILVILRNFVQKLPPNPSRYQPVSQPYLDIKPNFPLAEAVSRCCPNRALQLYTGIGRTHHILPWSLLQVVGVKQPLPRILADWLMCYITVSRHVAYSCSLSTYQ